MVVRSWLAVCCFGLFILVLGGCAGGARPLAPSMRTSPSLVTRAGNPNEFVRLSSLVLLPVRYEQKVRLLGDEVRERADRELGAAFARESEFKVISPSAVVKDIPEARHLDPRVVARRLGVDGVLITTVHQFVERDGTALGADRPATVDFSMRVVRADSGADIWGATYHYTDEPVSDNVFNLSARFEAGSIGRFASAQEILANGFSAAGRELAQARAGTFRR